MYFKVLFFLITMIMGITFSNKFISETSPNDTTRNGIWVSPERIAALPTSGPAWEELLNDAAMIAEEEANVSDQNSRHDVYTLAASLTCVRIGEYCEKAREGLLEAIGTETGGQGRWLAVGRNLTAYVITADLLDMRTDEDPESDGSLIEAWIKSFLTKDLAHNNTGEPVPIPLFASGSNAAAQQGAAFAAVAAYMGDQEALDRAWDAFRTFACDPSAPDREEITVRQGVTHGWAHDVESPCAINPAGTVKKVPDGRPGSGEEYRIDGAIINDMRRAGEYQWPPGYTQYPWVGIEGLVPAALILHRAGYPAFEVSDRAVLRSNEFMWYLREGTGDVRWFDEQRAAEVKHLVNVVYGRYFPVQYPVGGGRLVGYTDWTHPDGI